MKLLRPYINFDEHFAIIAALYDAKAAAYNTQVALMRDKGDNSAQFLRSAHRELYFDYVRSIKGNLAKEAYELSDVPGLLERNYQEPLILMTNRKSTLLRTKKSEATIYRLTQRLIGAGIIEKKIWHGSKMDYEMHFSTSMIPVSDYKNESFDPVTYILKNSIDSTISEALRSICTPFTKDKNILNNIIITENNCEHQKVSSEMTLNNEHSGLIVFPSDSTIRGNKVHSVGSLFSMKEELKENSVTESDYAQKLKLYNQAIEERTRRYAITLTEHVIAKLFPERAIYSTEREKAYKNAEHYFKGLNSATDCHLAMEQYKQRVDLVRQYLERNTDFDFSNIWPARYLDPENYSSGFVMTQVWLKKHQEFKVLQKKTRMLKTEQAIFDYALKRMSKFKNRSAYSYWMKYVSAKIPHRLSEYEICAKAIINN